MTATTRIGILELGRPTLATAARSMLEESGLSVSLWKAQIPADLFSVLEAGPTSPDYLIICADADAGGIVFPRIASEFDMENMRHGRLPFERIRERVFLPHKVVVGAGPGLGHPDCARALVDGGVALYFGAPGDVDGASILVWLSVFFTQHLVRGKTMDQACARAASVDAVAAQFRMYGPTGVLPLGPLEQSGR